MNEATTTEPQSNTTEGEQVITNPGDGSQPAGGTEGAAGAQTEGTQTGPTGTDETAAAQAATDERDTWLRNKGIDPSDPDAVHKVADAWRKGEQEFHKTRQESSTKLRDAVNTGDDLTDIRIHMSVSDFKNGLRDQGMTKDQIDELDAAMAAVVEERPHLATDLDAVYAIVQSKNSTDAIKAAEDRGREAAKAEIARSSNAKSPRGNASAGTGAKTPEEERLERFSKWD